MIVLRAIREEHIPFVQIYASNPIIGATSNVPSPYPHDGAAQWYRHISQAQANGSSKVFAIERDDTFSGVISLNKLNADLGEAAVDYWVRADMHNKGIASEAVSEVLEYARSLGFQRFSSGCLSSNEGSEKVLLKNGFTEVSRVVLDKGKFSGKEFISMEREFS